MDFSIPAGLSEEANSRLQELIQDYQDGDVTAKGYCKKRHEILSKYGLESSPLGSPSSNLPRKSVHVRNHSLASTIRSQRSQRSHSQAINDNYSIDTASMPESRRNSIYKVTTRNSSVLNSMASPLGSPAKVLDYGETDSCYNPMIPLLPRNNSPPMTDSLPAILRARSRLYERETAILGINHKNKETGISWDKLYLRAERVAHELTKHKLYKMDKVLLWFNRGDIVEFTVSLLGCFIAGMVAVPVSLETYSLSEISQIVDLTSATYSLIADECLKQIDNLHFEGNSKIKLTKSGFLSRMVFIRTDDMGTYSKAKKSNPTFDIPNVSYIEFTRTPLGRLSGVVMKHKILSKQLETMASMLNSRRKPQWTKGDIERSYKNKRTSSRYTMLSSLDPTRSTGLIFGILFNIYTGNLLITVDDKLLTQPGVYENIINKHRVNILLSDQLQLKQVVINYLENPALVTSKKNKVDFGCINWCIASCTNIDTEVTDMIVHKWLKNLGCLDASQCYSPMLTLLDFGGIFISMRDHLGNLGNFPVHDSKLRLQDELFIDKELLKENVVKPSITAMINSSSSTKDYLRLSCFGFPIPDSTVCIVNPDDNTLVPDLTVGELWISSPSITDEFYQMDRINDFVFNARLNFKKMTEKWRWTASEVSSGPPKTSERIETIMNICPPTNTFIRTKLMGFVHNGKIYVLSLIEDMFLQNKLIRLPNWSHTSDTSKAKKVEHSATAETNETANSLAAKRVVQTYFLQHVTENVVRMVDKAFEVSVFELPQNKDDHFLVMVVETPLASNQTTASTQISLAAAKSKKEQLEKKMTSMVEQIYKILWIFHRIQPLCVLLVTPRSLPRRYCSLEIANSTVEKKFLSGTLSSKFVKFQLDNVILDFIPYSSFLNESIFSEHLSTLRHNAIAQECIDSTGRPPALTWQTSGIDYRENSIDVRNNQDLTKFANIMEVLEWRSKRQGDEFAFSDGIAGSTANSANPNNVHSKVSWKSFNFIVGSFMKKIVQSKTPLRDGDHVIVLCDNSVEYVAIVLACFLCKLVVIPIATFSNSQPIEDVTFLLSVVRNYNVKRIFVDSKMQAMLEDGTPFCKALKKFRHMLPKVTVFSKIKKKTDCTPLSFAGMLKEKSGTPSATSRKCVIWIDREIDTLKEINVVMTHQVLLNMCKIMKETLQLTSDSPIISVYNHTTGLGFIQSCLIGVYVGTTSYFFNNWDIVGDCTNLLITLQNLNVKDLILSPEMLPLFLDRAQSAIESARTTGPGKKDSRTAKTTLRPDFLRNVQNVMIPFKGRPRIQSIRNCLSRYSSIIINNTQLNYLYQHVFNPLVSLRSYLGIPPLDIFLDLTSLREGIVREVDPDGLSPAELEQYLHLQDSGIVPVCTDLAIVNPETTEPCFENEIGEIWCCSEANVYDYYISKITSLEENQGRPSGKSKLQKLPFISAQFQSKLNGEADNGLSYLRTGDLGFIKTVRCTDSRDNVLTLSVLYVLGSINETVELLGLTHFVHDLETTVKSAHPCIYNCLVAKVGGLLSCLIECRSSKGYEYSNIAPLVVAALLKNNGVVLDLCCFIKPRSTKYSGKSWQNNRMSLLSDWLARKLEIEDQVGINYGENNSIYLLSDFSEMS